MSACSKERKSDSAPSGSSNPAVSIESPAGSQSQGSQPTSPAATGGSSEASAAPTGNGELIGVVMPTTSLQRWNYDGANLKSYLEKLGYKVDLQYADNKQDVQNSQLQNMINAGAKVLVVASIDGTSMAPILADAKAAGIKVIAYDRLINQTPDVDYYATFDNYKVGQLQGQYILDNMPKTDGDINLEPFAGSPDDNNAKFFFAGAWDKLGPLVAEGKLKVPSGKAPKSNDEWTTIGIQGWTSDAAQSEMQNRIDAFYADKKVNIILSPNDSLALGIEQALDVAGYKPGQDWPLITGQDGDKANVINMLADKQSMTIFKDTRKLGQQVAKMVDQIVKGETVDVNDTESYNNGVKAVPTFLLQPEVVTKNDVKSKLVDSGYYTAAELGL